MIKFIPFLFFCLILSQSCCKISRWLCSGRKKLKLLLLLKLKKRNVVESHVVWFLKRDLTRILMEICSYRFYLWQRCRVIIDFLCMVYALFTCRKYWRMIDIMPGISCKHCSRNSWHQKNAMEDWRRSHVGEHNLLHNTQLAVGHCG